MTSEETKTTYHLVMDSVDDFHSKHTELTGFRIDKLSTPSPEFNWFMYHCIGPRYRWGGRGSWTKSDWNSFATNPAVKTWGAYLEGTPVGYYELELTEAKNVKVHCIGLIESFIGQGLGSHLLSHCIDESWKLSPKKIILNTCCHDHPGALSNYLNRGFRIQETSTTRSNPLWTSKIFKNAE